LFANNQYDEKVLLAEMALGDTAAFGQIYQHYHPKIHHYILLLVKSPPLAQDLLQEVFVRLWEARGQLDGVKAFGPYLFCMARNHTINAMKAIARSKVAIGEVLRHYPEPACDDGILERDYGRFIQKVLQSLPPRTREIYRKCREEGKTYDEVARELGISGNAVKRHMVNSIRILREAAEKGLGISTRLLLVLLSLIGLSSH
jgi:RNA polymerase sigma-70 factor (family 1)